MFTIVIANMHYSKLVKALLQALLQAGEELGCACRTLPRTLYLAYDTIYTTLQSQKVVTA